MAATQSSKIEFFPYFNLFVQVSYFLMYSRHLFLCMVYSDIIFKPGIHLGIQNGCQYWIALIEMYHIEKSKIITFCHDYCSLTKKWFYNSLWASIIFWWFILIKFWYTPAMFEFKMVTIGAHNLKALQQCI